MIDDRCFTFKVSSPYAPKVHFGCGRSIKKVVHVSEIM